MDSHLQRRSCVTMKISKGKATDDTEAIARAGETIIHPGHWEKLTGAEKAADKVTNEKAVLAVLKATDSRKLTDPGKKAVTK